MSQNHSPGLRPSTKALVIGSLGVVFGDIGTSPLYSLRECFSGHHGVPPTPDNVLGVLSLIVWTLTLIVSIKYLVYVMRADRNGEGGILALLSLAAEKLSPGKRRTVLLLTGVAGAALLFGDGIITPAISVLSAVEGLNVCTPIFESYIVPITIVILVGLFMVQKAGTEKMGRWFGPVTIVWFLTLAVAGATWIVKDPGVLACVNPMYAVNLLLNGGWKAFFVLGGVFLVVTGGEALYADMGHFGAKPIRIGWFLVVFPALFLNYLGQGALLRQNPSLLEDEHFSPFYQLFPQWALIPMVILAGAATVIASQALITGTYSLTLQAIQLGYLPRLAIRHTSAHTRGQIYISTINWMLMFSCLGLVKTFGSSAALASAYGIAVTLTMLVTTLLFFVAARSQWGWSIFKAGSVMGICFCVELVFFGANATKILDGGWFPLVVGAGIFILMTTWRTGRRLVADRLELGTLPQEMLVESLQLSSRTIRVPGTAVFMASSSGRAPNAIMHNLKHNKVLHQRVIFLTIITEDHPYVAPSKQVELLELAPGFWRMSGHYGYLQEPDVPQLLRRAKNHLQFEYNPQDITYFLGRETIVASEEPGMALWREHIFAFLSRIAEPPGSFFRLPEGRVVELGVRIKI
ncbi:MAG: potassium transporter Kup [Verrucomicrobiota bacterium]